eukprot:tig00021434_g21305.t1
MTASRPAPRSHAPAAPVHETRAYSRAEERDTALEAGDHAQARPEKTRRVELDHAALKAKLEKEAELRGGAGPSSARALPEAPVDWTIKTHAIFLSSRPFEIARRLRASSAARAAAEACHPPEHPPAGETLGDGSRRLQQALAHWVFPAAPLPESVRHSWPSSEAAMASIATRAATESVAHVIWERRTQWENALSDAVMQVRAGRCDALYVVGRPWAALFLSWRVAGCCGQPAALVSRTSKGQRAYFRKSYAAYRTVGDEPEGSAPELERRAALDNMMNDGPSTGVGRNASANRDPLIVQGPGGPALLFEGHDGVCAIRDALIMMKPVGGDVPLLLAGAPFAHGSLRFCEARIPGPARRTPRGDEAHALEVTGPLLPHSLQALLGVLRDHHPFDFTGTFRTEVSTVRLSSPAFLSQPAAPAPRPGEKRKAAFGPDAQCARSPAFRRLPESERPVTRVACSAGRIRREEPPQ